MTFNEYFDSLYNKTIAVVGAGVSNLPLIRLLTDHGCAVTVCDKRGADELENVIAEFSDKPVSFKLGGDYLDDLDFELIFRTPGLHPFALKDAVEKGAELSSEMELFFRFCPCRIIAVTGSDGKTTTSTLTAELLKAAGYTVHLGGNIGKPLLSEIPSMNESDIAVLELSSFQLHSMVCRPDVAVVTNVSPNHLDVHPDYADYANAKKNIFINQQYGDRLILNADNEYTRAFAAESKADITWFSRREKPAQGYYCDGRAIYRGDKKIIDTADILLPGEHNIENLMAAFAATETLVPEDVFHHVAKTFAGVAHRLELVRTHEGVRYYNDSIGTSPTRTVAGLRSFNEKLILIAGGHDKGVPYDGLASEIIRSAKALFVTGESALLIKNAVLADKDYDSEKLPVFHIDDFYDCIKAAADYAKEGDIVLLSPACSSFDRFRNFVERGNTFKSIVEELK